MMRVYGDRPAGRRDAAASGAPAVAAPCGPMDLRRTSSSGLGRHGGVVVVVMVEEAVAATTAQQRAVLGVLEGGGFVPHPGHGSANTKH